MRAENQHTLGIFKEQHGGRKTIPIRFQHWRKAVIGTGYLLSYRLPWIQRTM